MFQFNSFYIKSDEDSIFAIRHTEVDENGALISPVFNNGWCRTAKSAIETSPYRSTVSDICGGIYAVLWSDFIRIGRYNLNELWGEVDERREIISLLEFSKQDVISYSDKSGEIIIRQCNIVWQGKATKIGWDFEGFFLPIITNFMQEAKKIPITSGIPIMDFNKELEGFIQKRINGMATIIKLIADMTIRYCCILEGAPGMGRPRLIHWFSYLSPTIPPNISYEGLHEIVIRIMNEFNPPLSNDEVDLLIKCLFYRDKEEVSNETELGTYTDAWLFALDFYDMMPLEYRNLKSQKGRFGLMMREMFSVTRLLAEFSSD